MQGEGGERNSNSEGRGYSNVVAVFCHVPQRKGMTFHFVRINASANSTPAGEMLRGKKKKQYLSLEFQPRYKSGPQSDFHFPFLFLSESDSFGT